MARGIRKSKLESEALKEAIEEIDHSYEEGVYALLFPDGSSEELMNHILYSSRAKRFREYLGIEVGRLEL